MHTIEPFYNWLDIYNSEDDEYSPFYGHTHSEFEYSNTLYNFYLHPQWDSFGTPTLYCKIVYANYEKQIAIIEFIGEWNDAINNDIMYLKENVIDVMLEAGISKFVWIGENILNFHYSDDCYYEAIYENLSEENGWVVAINFREHILLEMKKAGILKYVMYNTADEMLEWRKQKPYTFHKFIEERFLGNLLGE